MKLPWGIMMYKTWMAGRSDDCVSVWVKTEVVEVKSGDESKYKLQDRIISAKEARVIISRDKLELATRNAHGEIWHIPDNTIRDFMQNH